MTRSAYTLHSTHVVIVTVEVIMYIYRIHSTHTNITKLHIIINVFDIRVRKFARAGDYNIQIAV